MKSAFTFALCDQTDPYITPKSIPQFLTPDECGLLISLASQQCLQPSTMGGSRLDLNYRKSDQVWLGTGIHPLIKSIRHRARTLLGFPWASCRIERLQIVRYTDQGFYREHYDQSIQSTEYHLQQIQLFGGPRTHTLVIYLNDEYEGGETHFPHLEQSFRQPTGGALFFHNLNVKGTHVHPLSRHAGLPIKKGTKWIANLWFHST